MNQNRDRLNKNTLITWNVFVGVRVSVRNPKIFFVTTSFKEMNLKKTKCCLSMGFVYQPAVMGNMMKLIGTLFWMLLSFDCQQSGVWYCHKTWQFSSIFLICCFVFHFVRGTAQTITKMLETAFPGIDVILANYPPSLPKRLLGKLVPAVQIGVIAVVVAGEQIFPMLGFMAPPPWYYSLRANKFGTIASSWLLGNVAQSFLQSSGAFEVYLNDELVSNLSSFCCMSNSNICWTRDFVAT